jgi:PII-like signaling protein
MSGAALKLTVYLGERDRAGEGLAADALMDLLARRGVRASVMLRGIEGFGLAHSMHIERLLTLSEDLPIVVLALDEPARVEALLEEVRACSPRGLVTLERAWSGQASDGAGAPWGAGGAGPEAPSAESAQGAGEGVRLSVFTTRGQRSGGAPAHVAAVAALQRAGAWGASVLLGLDGTLEGERRRARVLAGNAGVPMLVSGFMPGALASAGAAALAPFAGASGVLFERVHVRRRDGGAARAPGSRFDGPSWQKLTVHCGEGARAHGQPLHEVLLRSLRRAGAAGATSLRAQWGFHGEHRPHGERLLSAVRHVPVQTTVVEEPARMAALLEVVDALTEQTGLVTLEIVPRIAPAEPLT